MVAGSGCKVSATADWLAVGGVYGEPVSLGTHSLLSRKNTGKCGGPGGRTAPLWSEKRPGSGALAAISLSRGTGNHRPRCRESPRRNREEPRFLRGLHADWSEQDIEAEVRRISMESPNLT
jgi:hypothetical protein